MRIKLSKLPTKLKLKLKRSLAIKSRHSVTGVRCRHNVRRIKSRHSVPSVRCRPNVPSVKNRNTVLGVRCTTVPFSLSDFVTLQERLK